MKQSHRNTDPYWTTARYQSTDKAGQLIRVGTRIFYYPLSRDALQGEAAEQASRDFDAACFDESPWSS